MAQIPPILDMQRLCRHCGYSLEGHSGEPIRCPECGQLNWTENRFQIMRRPLKLSPHYVVRDRREQPLYNIQPLPGLLKVSQSIQMVHVDGTETLTLKQRAFAMTPVWEIQRADRPTAIARRKMFSWWNYHWQIQFPGPDDITIIGNFTNREYSFRRGEETIAVVSRRWFSWRHSFGIEIRGGEDFPLLIAATVILDVIDMGGGL